MRRLFVALTGFFLLCTVLNAESTGTSSLCELIPSGHWIYDALVFLSLETGHATLAMNAPASMAETRLYLDAVPFENLSTPGQALYRKAALFLGASKPLWQTGAASLDIRPRLSLTARFRSSIEDDSDYERFARFNNTAPFLSLPLTVSFSPYLSVFADFSVGEGFWSASLSDNYTNVPATADSFDLNVPSKAYASAGNSFFTAVIGRGALNAGRTLSGSMILSDTADRLDYASIVFFSPGIRISLTPVELAPDRFVYYHDISVQPFSFLTLRFSEAATVNSTIDLRYLNPAMIYHSYAGWKDDYGESSGDPVGTQFAFAADLVPAKGLRLYGQFAMNQFQTAYELENYSGTADVIPNSLGGLAGVEYLRPFADGYLICGFEGVYTNPWLYILSNRDISFYWSRKELVGPAGYTTKAVKGWLGSPYGPDAIVCTAQVRYVVPFSLKAGLTWRYVCRGSSSPEFLDATGDNYYPKTITEATRYTPTGNPSYRNSLVLDLARSVTERLEISGRLVYNLSIGTEQNQTVSSSCTVAYALR